MKNSTFVKSVFVLALGGLIAKGVGAAYRIPLTWILGAQGLGMYQLVYPVFALLLVISSTGTPTAISTMVAERVGKGQYASLPKVLRVSVGVLLGFGLLMGAMLVGLSGVLANLQGNSEIQILYVIIAFAIPLVSVLSAYRGYFQGLMKMSPTAISQIIEQLGKLAVGLGLGWFLARYGVLYATIGAVCGVVISELMAVFYILVCYFRHKQSSQFVDIVQTDIESTKKLLKEFFANSLPIVLCGFVLPLLQMLDSLVVIKLLGVGGFDAQDATMMWGIASGVVGSLINLPVALSLSVATAVAPNVRDGIASRDDTIKKISQAHNMAINLSLPLGVLLLCAGSTIIPFLYQDSVADMGLGISLLTLYAPFVVIIALVQMQNAVLQGLKRSKVALTNMLVGGVCKVLALFGLSVQSQINIFGVIISNIVFYLIVCLLNYVYLHRKQLLKIGPKPIAQCAVVSAVTGVYVYIGTIAFEQIPVFWRMFVLLMIATSVYISTLWAVGGLNGVMGLLKKLKNRVYKQKTG